MSGTAISLVFLGLLLILLIVRVPIAVALIVTSLGGIAALRGLDTIWVVVGKLPYDFAAHWSLSAIPMFLLMGTIAFRGGLTTSLFAACRIWFGRLPGGLAIAANFASAMFAAASGSSLATAAAMGRIAVPEMLKSGYHPGLATGTVAAAGTIGAMIPPSVAFIIYGWYTAVPIGQLLIAGVLPGILTAVVYGATVVIRVLINPELAPRSEYRPTLRESLSAFVSVWPIPVLIGAVIGLLYSGFTTATEAGSIGAVAALLICALRGTLTLQVIRDSIRDAVNSTASILIIAVGAALLSKFLVLAGLPQTMGRIVTEGEVTVFMVIGFTVVLYLVLGMFLDPIGVMLVTLPILLPVYDAMDLNLIWMGVVVVKLIEIGLLTPPVGLNVYVVKSVVDPNIPVETIFKGVMWFLAAEIVITALLIFFPVISLWLPSQM
ncbi:TRAP transporter large permease subunit [Pseudooceanicola sp. 216_PA32_1]|uniref:TRAP transporter large permease protein n=1 Tax=Pseudooceanicola pacificus TaxID=2676438 RepID=A0A844W5I7_9RHOB|nr:TRAP transporter large permease [Pseudooceanicola pacificus]MWB78081.1 TRAP transporter large permease subunit [Pseudooceanicola pacificus]